METFPITLCLCFKTSPRAKHFQLIEFDLHENVSGAQKTVSHEDLDSF